VSVTTIEMTRIRRGVLLLRFVRTVTRTRRGMIFLLVGTVTVTRRRVLLLLLVRTVTRTKMIIARHGIMLLLLVGTGMS
jgi:hypothetical protein